ncbi:MAG: PhnE/PtxC family ABC transporter permease, partial [Gammaproteobacteria bacterium]
SRGFMDSLLGSTRVRRFEGPPLFLFVAYILGLSFFVWASGRVGVSFRDLIEGAPNMARLLGEMIPPDVSRINTIAAALLETFQIALVGTGFGILLGFAFSVLACRQLAPSRFVYWISRGLVALFRTVPDLIWAIFFVVTVGLGAFAGTRAIVVDTIGFCGRFFAEAMEEVDNGPQEMLAALGANRWAILFCAVVPAAMPSLVNTSWSWVWSAQAASALS